MKKNTSRWQYLCASWLPLHYVRFAATLTRSKYPRQNYTLFTLQSVFMTRDGTSDFFDSVKPAYHHKYRPHAAYITSQDFAFDSKVSSNENILMFIFPWNFILRPDVFIENYLLQDKGELNAKEILSYNLFQYNFSIRYNSQSIHNFIHVCFLYL